MTGLDALLSTGVEIHLAGHANLVTSATTCHTRSLEQRMFLVLHNSNCLRGPWTVIKPLFVPKAQALKMKVTHK